MQELRCRSTMHAKLDGTHLKIRCGRRACGAERGVVVIHTFDLDTGKLIGSTRYADPIVKESHADPR